MARQVALTCSACRRKFGGDEALKRHRVIAGDRYRCRSDAELLARNYYRDPEGTYHRGASLFPDATSTAVEGGRANGHPVVAATDASRMARATDPLTSHLAARAIAPRTGTLKAVLLAAYFSEPEGLTDAEAAARTGLDLGTQVTKRASELLSDGLIVKVSERIGRAGTPVRVCRAVSEAVSA